MYWNIMQRSLLTLAFICCTTICTHLLAQRTISGTITDADTGEPLISATITVKGGQGQVSDYDGNYSITVPDDCENISVSYIGYADQEIPLGASNVVDIQMRSGEQLDEVIVIGYGTVKREDATGSLQSVSSKDFNRGAITGPQELIAGKVAGVSITTSGDPGGGSKIRIRGESSISASNNPLIVIDGVPLDDGEIAGNRNPLDIINPNEIESFTVLKDASATAIYGNRASGGVILITTKKGKTSKKLNIGYSGNVSVGQIANKIDVLDAAEYRAIINERFADEEEVINSMGDASTDWQDEIYQNALGHEHNLNFSGGIEKLPYRLSMGFLDKNGLLKTDNYQRTSVGLNINPGFINNTLQVNIGVKGMWSKNRFADRGAIGNAVSFDPTQDILSGNDRFDGYTTWVNSNGTPEFLAPRNPVALLNQREDISNVNRLLANASVDYRMPFLPALRANLNVAMDRSRAEGTVFVDTSGVANYDNGGLNNRYDEAKDNDLLEFYLNYKESFGKSTVDIVGGYSWQHFQFRSNSIDNNVAGNDEVIRDQASELYLISLFGRLNYSFNDRYLLTASLRRDGTSRFSPENRWGLFPAVALAVKALENENTYFNSLKLRAGWGITGQENIGQDARYAHLSVYTSGQNTADYQFGNSFFTTLRPEEYDSQIQWEETTTLNVGADISLVRDRVSATVDVYQRTTEGMLNRIIVAAGSNLSNAVNTNIGTMDITGTEVSLFLTPIQTENLTWDLNFNTSYNVNEITKLTISDDPSYIGIQHGGIAGGVGSNIQIHSVGFAPSSFYVKEQLYDSEGNILEGEFADLDGDGVDNDFYRYEKPAADWSYGLTSSLSFKDLTFSFAARALTGNFIYNNVQTDIGFLRRLKNSSDVLYNIHQSAIDLNVERQSSLTFSDHFVVDASFLRVDHVTLSYNFNDLIGYNTNMFFTIQNPMVFTKYEGLDPETDNGIDNNLYPRPRTFVFGLSATF